MRAVIFYNIFLSLFNNFTKVYGEIKKVLKNTSFHNVFMKGIIISGSNESC